MKNNPKTIIQFQIRSSYGNRRVYPMCKTAKLLTELTGRKTLFPQDLAVMERLGYEIEWIPESI